MKWVVHKGVFHRLSKNTNSEVVGNGFGVLIDTGNSGCLGYIKINYCPMCGRELSEV